MRVLTHRPLVIFVIVATLLWASTTVVTGQALRVPISGTQTVQLVGAPDRVWSADGKTHIRVLPLDGTFAYSGDGISLSGSVSRRGHGWFDAGGNGNVEEVVTYVDASSGLTCQGPSNGKLTNFGFLGTVNARCSDGSLLQGTWDTEAVFDTQGNPIGLSGTFSGTLLIPSG